MYCDVTVHHMWYVIHTRGSTLVRGLSYSSYVPTPRFYTPSVLALQDTAEHTTLLCGCSARSYLLVSTICRRGILTGNPSVLLCCPPLHKSSTLATCSHFGATISVNKAFSRARRIAVLLSCDGKLTCQLLSSTLLTSLKVRDYRAAAEPQITIFKNCYRPLTSAQN